VLGVGTETIRWLPLPTKVLLPPPRRV
jgi:hypothetical protein